MFKGPSFLLKTQNAATTLKKIKFTDRIHTKLAHE